MAGLPWIWLTLIAVVLLLFAEHQGRRKLKAISKIAASTGFVGLALSSGALASSYGQAIVVALIASWIGDACLLSKRALVFLAGMGAFLISHVGFSFAFVIQGVSWGPAAVAAIVIGVLNWRVDRWLMAKVEPGFRAPVRAYIIVITVMASLAFGAWAAGHTWLIPLGAVAFALSDITVALHRFVEDKWVHRLVGLPLYYGAQLLLALSVGSA